MNTDLKTITSSLIQSAKPYLESAATFLQKESPQIVPIAKKITLFVISLLVVEHLSWIGVPSVIIGFSLHAAQWSGKEGKQLVETIQQIWKSQSIEPLSYLLLFTTAIFAPKLSLALITIGSTFSLADEFVQEPKLSFQDPV